MFVKGIRAKSISIHFYWRSLLREWDKIIGLESLSRWQHGRQTRSCWCVDWRALPTSWWHLCIVCTLGWRAARPLSSSLLSVSACTSSRTLIHRAMSRERERTPRMASVVTSSTVLTYQQLKVFCSQCCRTPDWRFLRRILQPQRTCASRRERSSGRASCCSTRWWRHASGSNAATSCAALLSCNPNVEESLASKPTNDLKSA